MNREEKKGEAKHERGVRHALDAVLVKAAEVTSSSATQVLETYGDALQPRDLISLYEMMRIPETVAEVAQEEAWKVLAESNRKEVEIVERLLDDQREGRKTDRVLAAIGWGITVTLSVFGWLIAVAIGIVGWVIAIGSILVRVFT